GSNIGLVISVFIYPGAIAFTRMLCDTHSDAMHFVIIATAAFEALYAHCASVLAMKLDMDAIFIIDPDLFSIIFLPTYFDTRKTPLTFTSIVFFQSSKLISSIFIF